MILRIAILYSIIFPFQLLAQEISFNYGEISAFEQDYKQVEYEPGASSVIFFKIKNISYETNDFGYGKVIELKYRAKVLTQDGKNDNDNLKIPYIKDSEFISLKFHTINYEEGNKIENELNERDFKDEKVIGDYYNKVIILEDIKVGTIIEYNVSYRSYSHWRINDWIFQSSFPVLHSELNAKIPSFYYFRTFFQNCDSVDVAKTEEYNQYMDIRYLGAVSNNGISNIKGLDYQFIKKNNVSFQTEPYLGSEYEYQQKVVFQLTATHYPGEEIKHLMTTWEDLHKVILENDYIYKKIQKSRFLSNIIKQLSIDSLSETEKIEAVFNYVNTQTTWNNTYRPISKINSSDLLKKENVGNTADINILLINLLRQANLPAYPVLISTRFNGKPYKDYPVADQFNSLIVYTEIDNQTLLLDAHVKGLPYTILPLQDLNTEGWMVQQDTAYWIPLKDYSNSLTQGIISMHLDESESYYSIDASMIFTGQTANKLFVSKDESGRDTIKTDLLINAKYALDYFELKPNKLAPLEVNFKTDVEFGNGNNRIYFQPVFTKLIDECFLSETDRKYPIDFIYNEDKNILYKIEIPKGYEVMELPKPIRLNLPDNSGSFLFNCAQNDSIIQFIFRINMSRSLFSNMEFESLKEFYTAILEKQNCIIVYQKIP